MLVAHEALVAQEVSPPAGGAELGQIAVALLMFLVVFLPLGIFVIRERAGKPTLVGRVADWMGEVGGLPRWAALPMLVAGLSGVAALIGVYWDVPIHMELGRDEGPLANPSHYPIYFGLMGIFASGVLSAALAKGALPARTFGIGPHWRAPMGSVFMMATGLVGVSGFPLDDLWHRFFGQDVTEWGPTHVLMIGGGVCVVLGIQLLRAEARQVGATGFAVRFQGPVLAGAWMMGASTFLMEFDLGVPQFPMLSQVVLVALISGWTLVHARLSWGVGGTVIALVVFLASRVLFSALPFVADLHVAVPLPYVVEAVVVEVVALAIGTRKDWRYGAAAGLGVGTVGLLGEWQISQWLSPNPWPAHELPLFLGYGVVAGVGGALIGVWQHQRVEQIATRPAEDGLEAGTAGGRFRARHAGGLLGALLVVGAMSAVVVPADPPPGLTADIRITDSPVGREVSNPHGGGEPRWVDATITLSDPAAADGAVWLNGFAWQGGDFFTDPLVEVAPGTYRTARPLPVYGQWKAGVRIHVADRLMALAPIYAPADPAADAPSIPAVSGTREFVSEISFLQRERKAGTPLVLWTIGYTAVGLVFAAMWAFFAWLYAQAASGAATGGRRLSKLF